MCALKSTYIRQFQKKLLKWFVCSQRELPWRKNRTPYRVWISEMMLQQTRVDQVIPYYQRFMQRFPSLKSLSQASQQEVLKYWEGLGYYARARNMHKTAQILREKNGRFPRKYQDLLSLPGIGPYSAAAIASIAFHEPVSLVDGNVTRVLARVFAFKEDVAQTKSKKQLRAWANALLPEDRARDFNEAMMELGALVCLPKNPLCIKCPISSICQGNKNPTKFPVKKKKAPVPLVKVGAGLVRNAKGHVLIAQRHNHAMLGGLWEFPGGKIKKGETIQACIEREIKEELGVEIKIGKKFMLVQHAYSHFKIEMHVYSATWKKGKPRALDCANWAWCAEKNFKRYPFSRADLKIIEKLALRKM